MALAAQIAPIGAKWAPLVQCGAWLALCLVPRSFPRLNLARGYKMPRALFQAHKSITFPVVFLLFSTGLARGASVSPPLVSRALNSISIASVTSAKVWKCVSKSSVWSVVSKAFVPPSPANQCDAGDFVDVRKSFGELRKWGQANG